MKTNRKAFIPRSHRYMITHWKKNEWKGKKTALEVQSMLPYLAQNTFRKQEASLQNKKMH